MRFYGKMLISPIHKPPFEVLAHWKYKDGIWYGNDESFPAEICKFVSMVVAEQPISNPSELVPENDTQELWALSGQVKGFVAYAALRAMQLLMKLRRCWAVKLMAYQCTKTNKECDGCGECKQTAESCPNCGETGFEVKYYIGIEWIGCDECVRKEFPR